MSRRSSVFAEGQAKFSWRIEKQADGPADRRYKATCKNDPAITAFGETEEKAIRAADHVIEDRVKSARTAMPGVTQY